MKKLDVEPLAPELAALLEQDRPAPPLTEAQLLRMLGRLEREVGPLDGGGGPSPARRWPAAVAVVAALAAAFLAGALGGGLLVGAYRPRGVERILVAIEPD